MEFFRTDATIEVFNIKWDTDEETIKANDLPTELTLTLGEEIEISEGGCYDEEEIHDKVVEYLTIDYEFPIKDCIIFVSE